MAITYILFEKPNVENVMGIHKVGGSDHTKWVGGVSIQMQLGPCLVIIRVLSGYRY